MFELKQATDNVGKMREFYSTTSQRVERSEKPFRHFVLAPVLENEEATQILNLLDASEWQQNKGPFFSFDVPAGGSCPGDLYDYLNSRKLFSEISQLMSKILSIDLCKKPIIDAHRYKTHSGIGPHTDNGVSEARFVLNLNKSWKIHYGGIWVLSNAPNLSGETRYMINLLLPTWWKT